MEYIQGIITILSLIAAIMAWFVKLRWANEYKEAKEAQINVLERELESYKEMTPMKIREYFISTKEMLEENIKHLEVTIDEKNKEITELDHIYVESEYRSVEAIREQKEEITILRNQIIELEKERVSSTDAYNQIVIDVNEVLDVLGNIEDRTLEFMVSEDLSEMERDEFRSKYQAGGIDKGMDYLNSLRKPKNDKEGDPNVK